jgi:hypothetical protein
MITIFPSFMPKLGGYDLGAEFGPDSTGSSSPVEELQTFAP